jgi:hypothetical protein
MAHCEVPHKQGWIKGTNCRSGPWGPKFQPVDKANAISDCLEKRFTPYKLYDENHERLVEATVKALLVTVINDPPEKV